MGHNQEVFRTPRIAIKLDEISSQNAPPKAPQKVQLLKTGKFSDPRYGEFIISKQMLSDMKDNFDSKVRGIDISIDYAHNSQLEAAGWIQGLELLEDPKSKGVWQLWADVKWTPNGEKKLSDAEFRYLSADFVADYQDNETKKNFGPCLLGAGLTNRPVIKGMAPAIELQEGKESNMDEKDKKMKELSDELQAVQGKHKELEEKHAKMSAEYAEFKKKLSGNLSKEDGDGAKADDGGPGENDEKKDDKELSELKSKVEELEKSKKLAEQKSTFAKLLAEGKAVPAQEESFLKGDMVKFAELQAKVNLSPRGHGGQILNEMKSAADEVLALAHKKVNEKSAADLGAAISLVLSEDKAIADRYYSESATSR